MNRERKIKAIGNIIEFHESHHGGLPHAVYSDEWNNLAVAIVDSMEIKFNKEKIEHLANYLSEFATNGKCCLPDLTPYSRQLMISRVKKIVEIFTEDIIKIKETL